MQEIHSGNRLISSVFRQDPSHHSLTAPLYFEGKNFGAFGTTDMNGPFTEAQKALLLEVVHFTELAMNHQIQAFLLQDEENYYVIRLLQGYPADELSTSYYLQARNYTNEDIWYLYQFSLLESDVSDTRQSAYIHQIKIFCLMELSSILNILLLRFAAGGILILIMKIIRRTGGFAKTAFP